MVEHRQTWSNQEIAALLAKWAEKLFRRSSSGQYVTEFLTGQLPTNFAGRVTTETTSSAMRKSRH